MNKFFRKPTIREVLQRELYEAERAKIDADKMAEQWRAQAECAHRRVANLRSQLASSGPTPVPA